MILDTKPMPTGLTAMAMRAGLPGVACDAMAIIIGTSFLALSAKAQIPFWPVPITMQTFVVLVLAMTLRPPLATATTCTYLGLGALGLPVFAGTPERGVGLAYMAGPTGGYLAGFLLATLACGWLASRGWSRTILRAAAALLAGHAIILGAGFLWLACFVGAAKAYAVGIAPFYAATAVKTLMAMAFLPVTWRALARASKKDQPIGEKNSPPR